MNIRELNSYVREGCGGPSVALLKSEEIDRILLGEITMRQGQMLDCGKQLLMQTDTISGLTKTGTVALDGGKSVSGRPDYVRIDCNHSGTYDLMEIVNDVDALTLAEADGRFAILFYGSTLLYELSWEPTGDELLQCWWDKDVSTLLQINSAGTLLPRRFDFAIGDAAIIKCLAIVIGRDETKRTFADIHTRNLATDLMRWERQWDQFLYQSVTAGSTSQRQPFRARQSRRLRNLPY